MFELHENDRRYLTRQISFGQAVLVLGAGASITSKNRFGGAIKSGSALARTLCEEAGFPFAGEPLPTVFEAIRGRLSDPQIQQILRREYCDTTPSPELAKLFTVPWRRLYTFNVDDTIDNLTDLKSKQRRRYFNGMIDRVAEFEGPLYLQIIYLNGQASKPEHGLIFSESEFARAAGNETLHWYRRAGQDYFSCPVFIGSRLDEPILWAQIERAKRTENTAVGLGFVATPGKITQIQAQNLRNHGIVHIEANLVQFSEWINREFPKGHTPQDVVRLTSIENQDLSVLTPDDINAAHYLKPVLLSNAKEQFSKKTDTQRNLIGRRFYEGFPPSWELAASEIPVNLQNTNALYDALQAAIKASQALFVVTGQAGSGKTTAIMMALLRYMRDGDRKVYEVTSDVRSIRHIFTVLRKLGQPAIVYIGDLFLYGDSLADDLEQIKGEQILAVSSARSGEWNEHFSRHLARFTEPHAYNRFTRADYQPLLTRLNKYVPAPAFHMLTPQQQLQRLSNSKRQLLIALHEATSSENFAEIIRSEYEHLPDEDTKRLFLIVGLGTMARVGVGLEFAAAAYEGKARRSLKSALEALAGIVELNERKRLIGRHESYVRQIFEKAIDFETFASVVEDLLTVYANFEVPVIRKVNRTDGYLFKHLLNADFIHQMSSIYGDPEDGRRIYERFEVSFQLDGHFWLQFGLFLIKCNKYEAAHKALTRSIQAYPENLYARHALAHLKLRMASHRAVYDSMTQQLVDEAVQELELEHSRTNPTVDNYPLVTLAMAHIQVLANHNQRERALVLAKQYHARLQELGRQMPNNSIDRAAEAMLKYVTLGEVPGRLFGPANPRRRKASREA